MARKLRQINIHGVSTKQNNCTCFIMQRYKDLITALEFPELHILHLLVMGITGDYLCSKQ